jgi:hypothetical protein
MRRIILSLAYAGLALLPVLVVAQTPTPFPQTLPSNSVVGRLGQGVPGPAEAIPFSTLSAQMFGSTSTVSFSSLGIGCTAQANGIIICNAPAVANTNGQAVLGSSSTAGGVYGGQGSSTDLVLQNKTPATVCSIATGTTTLNCTNITLTNPLVPGSGGTNSAFFSVAGPTATRIYTFPDSAANIASLNTAGQVVSGGANVTSLTQTTGNLTVNCGLAPLQFQTNGGAFTLTAPVADGSCILLSTNNASAGAISFSGFSVGANTGDALTTTNTQKFSIMIWRINGVSGYRVAAHQ